MVKLILDELNYNFQVCRSSGGAVEEVGCEAAGEFANTNDSYWNLNVNFNAYLHTY